MEHKSSLNEDLIALSALADDEIDTSEIPERLDFARGVRAKFLPLSAREYDIRAIANWCIKEAWKNSIKPTNLWLNKMVFFIYETALRSHNILLTNAKAEAWAHGPVFREVYFASKGDEIVSLISGFDPKTRRKVVAEEAFSELDLQIFRATWARLAHLSPSRLRNLSHQDGGAWHRVWNYRGNSNPGMEIDITTILSQDAGK